MNPDDMKSESWHTLLAIRNGQLYVHGRFVNAEAALRYAGENFDSSYMQPMLMMPDRSVKSLRLVTKYEFIHKD